MDFLRGSTMQPVVIGQVGEGLSAAGIRAMALGAIVLEQIGTNSHGLAVFGHFLNTHRGKASVQGGQIGFSFLYLSFISTDLRPFKLSRKRPQTWIGNEIENGKDNGGNKQPHPPTGHRVVQFAQVTVPNVASRVVSCRINLFTGCQNQ